MLILYKELIPTFYDPWQITRFATKHTTHRTENAMNLTIEEGRFDANGTAF